MNANKIGDQHTVNLEQFLDDIKVVVRDGEELLKAGFSGVRERATLGAQATDKAVRSHPYQTVGIVFGVGFVVGLLLRGTSRKPRETNEHV